MIKELKILDFSKKYNDYYKVEFSINGHIKNKVLKLPKIKNIDEKYLIKHLSNIIEREAKILKDYYKRNEKFSIKV